MISSYRNRTLYVSAQTYAALKVFADWHEYDCPDTVAEAWLQDRISDEPQLKRFAAEQKKRMDQLRAEARDWPDDAEGTK